MKFVRLFFFSNLLLSIAFLNACSKGELVQESQIFPFQISSKEIVDYTNTNVSVKILGDILEGSVSENENILFYRDSACSGSPIGSALVDDLKTVGANLDLPVNQVSSIYISSVSSSECLFVEDYSHEALLPTAPVFDRTEPTSPSREVMSPGLFGTAFPPSATLEVFSDDICSLPISSGPVSSFTSFGLIIPLTANTVTTLYGFTLDPLGQQSACTELVTYEHNTSFSSPPRLTFISHASPSNQSFTPTLRGAVDVNATSVGLYSDSGCSNEFASGTPDDFLNVGFQVTSTPNSTISIYARSLDDVGQPSVCALLTTYTHDDVDPVAPSFVSVNPVSPTNATTSPAIIGTSSADTELVTLYSSNTCLTALGSGTKALFESTGINGSVGTNTETDIHAKAFDSAGNDSSCVLMTNFVHNTIPPGAPLFSDTTPASPTNQSLSPFVRGVASDRTLNLNFYKDDLCTQNIGSGNRATYEGAGIQVTVDANTNTSIYVTVSDFEGNVSECTFHAPYDHSNAPAPAPGFFRTFPDSPTKASNNPSVIGTADSIISSVTLYDDNSCSTSLGSGSRGQFISSGIVITVPVNSTLDLHAQSTDIYGNLSPCTFLTQFIHNTVAPTDPTYTAVAPVSPNNSSFTPTITGTALVNPASQLPPSVVSFFDSPSCVSKIGEGTPTEFQGAGVVLNLAQNAESFVYARVFDEASNASACTFLTSYIHNALQPASPVFGATSPASPSYSTETNITGSFGSSPDFMNRVSVIIYSDPACSTQVATGSPAAFEGAGIPLVADQNTNNTWFGVSVNEVGTLSNCVGLTNFLHHDSPITGLSTSLNPNGSVFLNWTPDVVPNPSPTYSVERSLSAGGPFSVISSGQVSNSFLDLSVTDNTQYFYRVFGTNVTGRGQNSAEASINIVSPPSVQPTSLSTIARDSQISLLWTGFPQNMTYSIERSTNFGGPFVKIGTDTTSTSYVDSPLTNGQTYYYVVTASNPSGLSMRSNIAAGTPLIVPDAPTELSIEPFNSLVGCGGASGLRMSWTATSYDTGYRISSSQNKGGNNQAATSSNNQHDFCSPTGAEHRYYRVSANWGSGVSIGPSNPMGHFARGGPSFSIFPGDGEIVLDWNNVNAPTSPVDLSAFQVLYDLYRSDDYRGEFDLYQTGLTDSTYTDVLANGTAKYYYVQPYLIDGGGDKLFMSYPTPILSGVPDVNPTAPTNLTAVEIPEENRLQLNWTPPDHYNGFLLYQAAAPGGPFTQVQYITNPYLLNAPLLSGMNYFKVTTAWGSFESVDSNVVSFRNAPISGFSANSSATSVTLNWNTVSGVQDYVVFRATDLAGPYSSLGVALTNTFEDTTAVTGTGYYYKVRTRFADFTEGQLSVPVAAMRTDSNTPSNVSLSQVGPSAVQATWAPVAGATNYIIRTSDSFAGTYVSRGSTTANNFNILGNPSDQELFVTVTAVVSLVGHTSAPVSIFTYGTPNAPTGEEGNNQVVLTWSAVTSVVSYDVLRTQDGVTFTTLASSYPTTTYADLTALNGNIYFYKIRLNFPGGVTRETDLSLPRSPGQTPLAPNGLNAENNNTGSEVILSWGRVSGVTRYNIYRSTTSGSYGAPIQTSTNPNGTTITGMTSGTTYFFRVSALNGSQEGGLSNEISIIPSLNPPAPIAEYSDPTSIDISWLAVAGASTYSVDRSTNGLTFNEIANGLAGLSFNDATIDPNKTYYYRFRSFAASGAELATSDVSQAANVSIEPQVPLGFQLNAPSTSSVILSWVSVPSVFGYEILRGTSSGGPYSLIASPLFSDESYTDTSVVPGTTYYYVMRSLNLSKTPSPNSVEKAVNLVAAPASLVAVNTQPSVDLTWSSVPGALTYNVKRSRVAGGPYGQIANTALLSYSDTDLVADFDYFYVVEAVFAGDVLSPQSSEASVNRDGFLDLQVVVELTDTQMLSSDVSVNTFERTQTSFDTSYYDGVTSYEFEVVAINFDGVSRSISILDSSDAIVGSLVVPTGLLAPTRIKVSFSPNVGADVYRLSLEQTGALGDLMVSSAKLLVNQVGATKTRLYFPLLSSESSPSTLDVDSSVYETSANFYVQNPNAFPFERRVSVLDKIVDYNAWAIESVVSTSGIAEGVFALNNANLGLDVEMTETRFVNTVPTLAVVPIDEGAANFSLGNENEQYVLNLKCEYNCGTGVVRLHKAGLWVELENLAKARIVNRIHSGRGLQSSATDLFEDRILYEASRYTNPKVYFQTYVEDDNFSDGSLELVSHAQDSGGTGLSTVVGSNLFVDNDSAALLTSPQLVMPSNERIMTRVIPVNGELDAKGSQLIIDVE